jgi:hypothetical protein
MGNIGPCVNCQKARADLVAAARQRQAVEAARIAARGVTDLAHKAATKLKKHPPAVKQFFRKSRPR